MRQKVYKVWAVVDKHFGVIFKNSFGYSRVYKRKVDAIRYINGDEEDFDIKPYTIIEGHGSKE